MKNVFFFIEEMTNLFIGFGLYDISGCQASDV